MEDQLHGKADRTILLFDLGGGTLDVSILSISKDSVSVQVSSGDNNLGGIDFTDAIFNHCVEIFQKKTGITISK